MNGFFQNWSTQFKTPAKNPLFHGSVWQITRNYTQLKVIFVLRRSFSVPLFCCFGPYFCCCCWCCCLETVYPRDLPGCLPLPKFGVYAEQFNGSCTIATEFASKDRKSEREQERSTEQKSDGLLLCLGPKLR